MTTDDPLTATLAAPPVSLFAPFSVPVFRRIWFGSLLTNFGLLINGVGAAWAMVQLTDRADMVALVQTALMMPIFLISMGAGALADMFDRRKVGLFALCVGCASASLLTLVAWLGLLTPTILLAFCFAVGTGMALFGPSWQASVGEQVPAPVLPQAVALNSISYNIARSFGPAIGGVIVAAAGATAAFVCNTLFYVPLMLVLLAWRRQITPSRLPPERIGGALTAGIRFIIHSPPTRTALLRALALGVTGGSILGLMPMIAKELLGGTAEVYGLVLGAFGIGAVLGGLVMEKVRAWLSTEAALSLSSLVLGLCVIGVALSHSLAWTMALLAIGGALWTQGTTLLNIFIQLSAPRWVSGRALAAYQAAIAGGIAIGSWAWGAIASSHSVSTALLASGVAIAATPLLALGLRLRDATLDNAQVTLGEVDVALKLTGRSGPIIIELEYIIELDDAREFYHAMQQLRSLRQRNGAFDWSLARDIANPRMWTERYVCPTWHEYLRQRDRNTRGEMEVIARAGAYHRGAGGVVVRRRLERPFGSVRWRQDTRDEGLHDALPINVGPS